MLKHLTLKSFNNCKVNLEYFDSANEVVSRSAERELTDRRFNDMKASSGFHHNKDWYGGISNYDEAMELMRTGYADAVEALKSVKPSVSGNGKRTQFYSDVVGFTPIVPLALMNVPNSMVNMRTRAIKTKVLNVYYDTTCPWSTENKDILEVGKQLLSAVMRLELEGYRFNLYAVQSYCEGRSADVMCVKVKSANTPLDLKRISFPLTHTGFFRVIGFDWYSRVPGGTYRDGYGRSLAQEMSSKERYQTAFKEMFGDNSVAFACSKIIGKDDAYDFAKILTETKG